MRSRSPFTRLSSSLLAPSLLAALAATACQPRPRVETPNAVASTVVSVRELETRARAHITAEYLCAQVAKVASDELAGRGPATAGDQATRAYLAAELAALGFSPGARGMSDSAKDGWEQPFELVGVKVSVPEGWTFARGSESVSLARSADFVVGTGLQTSAARVDDAELVFVGYGIEAPEYGWDDFKGQDVRGKVLVFLNNDPDWDPALFAGTTRLYYGRWTYKYESALRHGAVGALIVHTTASAGYPYQVVQTSWGGEQFALPRTGEQALPLKGWLTEQSAQSLAKLAGTTLQALEEKARSKSFAPVPLGIRTSLALTIATSRKPTANVVGILPGQAPQLRDEMVVLTAHHDHLGVGKADARGDTIYNGALDNGAGMAQVLALAKAFSAGPRPRRSIMVMFPAAEESGLLGSEYFTTHLPVPAARLVANVNFDGGNIWGRARDITQVGRGKSSLDALVDHAAAVLGRVVVPDQFPDRGAFYRSDQFNFAKIGVPALYLKTGTDFVGRPPGWGKEQILAFEAQHYHQPSDELRDDWRFEGMVDDEVLAFEVAWVIAHDDTVPLWRRGDEFEAVRKRDRP